VAALKRDRELAKKKAKLALEASQKKQRDIAAASTKLKLAKQFLKKIASRWPGRVLKPLLKIMPTLPQQKKPKNC